MRLPCGQSLIPDGVAIDMSSLSKPPELQNTTLQIDAGARWSDVLNVTLPCGLMPPVLPDFLELSIGGTLSVGGVGCQSACWGALTDHAKALEVVTGTGDIVTCSPSHNIDLFDSCRAGLGQAGIITRATLNLVKAPQQIRCYKALYGELGPFLADLEMLALTERFDTIQGFAIPNIPATEARFSKHLPALKIPPNAGRWVYYWEATKYFTSFAGLDDKALLQGLSFLPEGCYGKDMTFFDFANRVASSFDLLKQRGLWQSAHPWINTFVPAGQALKLLGEVMYNLDPNDMGDGPVAINPLVKSKFSTPSLRLPEEKTFFLFALLRYAVPSTLENIQRLLLQNSKIFSYLQAAGGISYLIDTLPSGTLAWSEHFGPYWTSFLAAKQKYDPHQVLASLLRMGCA